MIRENPVTLGLFAAIAGLALVPTSVLAGTQDIGTITMYLCDGSEDVCSNTLYIPNTTESQGQFTEDFTFNFVNTFPAQNNVPVVDGNCQLCRPLS
jgi:hypothetical protein